MAERKSLSKKVRFEVFKRDGFTCQYCGRMAPDVVLEVDHINPVDNGGNNGIMNLVTSCFDCNRGKGKRKLTNKDEIIKQQEQLKELSVKREQLQMMLKWRDELNKFDEEQLEKVENLFSDKTGGSLTDIGRELVRKWIKKFGIMQVIESTDISINQYYRENDKDTIQKVFDFIPKIAYNRSKEKDDPTIRIRNKIKYSLRNKINYFNEMKYAQMIRSLNADDYDDLYETVKMSYNWSQFVENFNEMFGGDW